MYCTDIKFAPHKNENTRRKLGTQWQQFVFVKLDNALALLFLMKAPIVGERISFDVMQFYGLLFFSHKTI